MFWPATQASHVDLLFYRSGSRRAKFVQVKSAYRYKNQLIVRTHIKKYTGLKLDYLGVADVERGVWLIPWAHLRGRQTIKINKSHEKWRIR